MKAVFIGEYKARLPRYEGEHVPTKSEHTKQVKGTMKLVAGMKAPLHSIEVTADGNFASVHVIRDVSAGLTVRLVEALWAVI